MCIGSLVVLVATLGYLYLTYMRKQASKSAVRLEDQYATGTTNPYASNLDGEKYNLEGANNLPLDEIEEEKK